MPRTLPFALLTLGFLLGALCIGMAHAHGAFDGLEETLGVVVDRVLDGDFAGAFDALTAFARN
jgi:hypothetical protein